MDKDRSGTPIDRQEDKKKAVAESSGTVVPRPRQVTDGEGRTRVAGDFTGTPQQQRPFVIPAPDGHAIQDSRNNSLWGGARRETKKVVCQMDDMPNDILMQIVKRVIREDKDKSNFSLVSKRLNGLVKLADCKEITKVEPRYTITIDENNSILLDEISVYAVSNGEECVVVKVIANETSNGGSPPNAHLGFICPFRESGLSSNFLGGKEKTYLDLGKYSIVKLSSYITTRYSNMCSTSYHAAVLKGNSNEVHYILEQDKELRSFSDSTKNWTILLEARTGDGIRFRCVKMFQNAVYLLEDSGTCFMIDRSLTVKMVGFDGARFPHDELELAASNEELFLLQINRPPRKPFSVYRLTGRRFVAVQEVGNSLIVNGWEFSYAIPVHVLQHAMANVIVTVHRRFVPTFHNAKVFNIKDGNFLPPLVRDKDLPMFTPSTKWHEKYNQFLEKNHRGLVAEDTGGSSSISKADRLLDRSDFEAASLAIENGSSRDGKQQLEIISPAGLQQLPRSMEKQAIEAEGLLRKVHREGEEFQLYTSPLVGQHLDTGDTLLGKLLLSAFFLYLLSPVFVLCSYIYIS